MAAVRELRHARPHGLLTGAGPASSCLVGASIAAPSTRWSPPALRRGVLSPGSFSMSAFVGPVRGRVLGLGRRAALRVHRRGRHRRQVARWPVGNCGAAHVGLRMAPRGCAHPLRAAPARGLAAVALRHRAVID